MKKNKKRLLALLTSASIALSMSGCANAKKDNVKKDSVFEDKIFILEDTIFDHAEVVLADDKVIIARNLIDSINFQSEAIHAGKSINYHEHYQDITNGIKFTSKDCYRKGNYVIYDDIQKLGEISDYLTEEELNKSLTEKGLSNEEIINIIKRIQKEVKEDSNVLTK